MGAVSVSRIEEMVGNKREQRNENGNAGNRGNCKGKVGGDKKGQLGPRHNINMNREGKRNGETEGLIDNNVAHGHGQQEPEPNKSNANAKQGGDGNSAHVLMRSRSTYKDRRNEVLSHQSAVAALLTFTLVCLQKVWTCVFFTVAHFWFTLCDILWRSDSSSSDIRDRSLTPIEGSSSASFSAKMTVEVLNVSTEEEVAPAQNPRRTLLTRGSSSDEDSGIGGKLCDLDNGDGDLDLFRRSSSSSMASSTSSSFGCGTDSDTGSVEELLTQEDTKSHELNRRESSGSDISGTSEQDENEKALDEADIDGGDEAHTSTEDDPDAGDKELIISPETSKRVVNQIESMFSDDHLAKDGFLLKHVRRRSDGFVSLKLVAGLRKVKQISREFPVILGSLRQSQKLEINSDGTKVRRVDALTPYLKSLPTTAQKRDSIDGGKGTEAKSSTDEHAFQRNQQSGYNRNGNGFPRQNNGGSSGRGQTGPKGGPYRKDSMASNTSGTSSRNGSFSKPHPADLLRGFQDAYTVPIATTTRPRGKSLPMPAQRGSICAMMTSSGSSPPNSNAVASNILLRPKSNSYCEGAGPSSMSTWLQQRRAASSRNSEGQVVISGVIRQPRGPDGTRGFAQSRAMTSASA